MCDENYPLMLHVITLLGDIVTLSESNINIGTLGVNERLWLIKLFVPKWKLKNEVFNYGWSMF